jgi:hypothetical protein
LDVDDFEVHPTIKCSMDYVFCPNPDVVYVVDYHVVFVANATNCHVLIVIDYKFVVDEIFFKFHFLEIDDTKLHNVSRCNHTASKHNKV